MLIEESTTGDFFSQIWTMLGSDFLPLPRRSTGWNMKFLTLSAISDGRVSRTSRQRFRRICACMTTIIARMETEEVVLRICLHSILEHAFRTDLGLYWYHVLLRDDFRTTR